MGYPPVVVVESGGVPRTQVAEGVSAPAYTVVDSGARPITLADNAPPIALFNEDGTPYTGGGVQAASFAFSAPVMIRDIPPEAVAEQANYKPQLIDMRNEVDWPSDFLAVSSTDHSSGDGGIYYDLCNLPTGDIDELLDPDNWFSYTEAVADGLFDHIETKPSANPVFTKSGEGKQIETAWLTKVGSTWVMTYQQDTTDDYTNQATMRGTSTDRLNWTTSNNAFLKANTNTSYNMAGNGHTGYAAEFENPFPDDIYSIYSDHVAYGPLMLALHGGSSNSVAALYGGSDLVAGTFPALRVYHRNRGRFTADLMEWYTDEQIGITPAHIDVGSIRAAGEGRWSCIATGRMVAFGNDKPIAGLYECLYDDYFMNMLKKPIPLVEPADLTGLRTGNSSTLFVDGKAITVFTGYYGGENINRLYIMSSPIKDPANTNYVEPSIPTPSNVVTQRFNFVEGSSALTGLTEITVGSPSKTFSTDVEASGRGMNITLNGALTPDPEYYLAEDVGFVPQDTQMAEMYVWDFRASSANSSAPRILFLGFAKDKAARSVQTDYIGLTNSTTANIYKQVRKAGVDTSTLNELYYPVGYNSSVGFRNRKGLGIRWFPQDGKCYLLGEGRAELEEITVPGDWDMSTRLYPIFGLATNGSISYVERVSEMTVAYAPVM